MIRKIDLISLLESAESLSLYRKRPGAPLASG